MALEGYFVKQLKMLTLKVLCGHGTKGACTIIRALYFVN